MKAGRDGSAVPAGKPTYKKNEKSGCRRLSSFPAMAFPQMVFAGRPGLPEVRMNRSALRTGTTAGQLLVINGATVEALVSAEEAIDLAEAALRKTSIGVADQDIRRTLAMPGMAGSCLSLMYASLSDRDCFGAKVLSVFPQNFEHGLPSHQGGVLLFEKGSGRPVALVNGHAITGLNAGRHGGRDESAVPARCLRAGRHRLRRTSGPAHRSHCSGSFPVRRPGLGTGFRQGIRLRRGPAGKGFRGTVVPDGKRGCRRRRYHLHCDVGEGSGS